MTYTFNELINITFKESQTLINDMNNLKNMLNIPKQDITNFFFTINKTEELTLILEKNPTFLTLLKKIILKKYGFSHNTNQAITINNVINKILSQEIIINTDLNTFKSLINKITTNHFYQNNPHPPILINNRFGTYSLSITAINIKLSGISGYLKDVHLIYDAHKNSIQLKSYGPKLNTKDLEFLINLSINKNFFNSYYQTIFSKEINSQSIITIPEINNERFTSWNISEAPKKLILNQIKKLNYLQRIKVSCK